MENKLHVFEQIRGMSVAANAIEKRGIGSYYNLIILNSEKKTVQIISYARDQIITASKHYADVEKEAEKGARIEPVL